MTFTKAVQSKRQLDLTGSAEDCEGLELARTRTKKKKTLLDDSLVDLELLCYLN